MSREDKIKFLEQHGWHQWYSQTHYVHQNIFEFFEKSDKPYWGSVDYTNYQMSVDEAYDLQIKFESQSQ